MAESGSVEIKYVLKTNMLWHSLDFEQEIENTHSKYLLNYSSEENDFFTVAKVFQHL